MNKTIRTIEEIINKYQYKQESFLNIPEPLTIYIDPCSSKLCIPNFYNYSTTTKLGTCAELMVSAYYTIQKTLPNLHLYYAGGHDPTHFKKDQSTHFFLIALKHNLPLQSGSAILFSQDSLLKKEILNTTPILIDPSFQKVTPFQDSNYELKMIGSPLERTYNNALVLDQNHAIPLAMSSYGLLWLTWRMDYSRPLVLVNTETHTHHAPEDPDFPTTLLQDNIIRQFYKKIISPKIISKKEEQFPQQIILL